MMIYHTKKWGYMDRAQPQLLMILLIWTKWQSGPEIFCWFFTKFLGEQINNNLPLLPYLYIRPHSHVKKTHTWLPVIWLLLYPKTASNNFRRTENTQNPYCRLVYVHKFAFIHVWLYVCRICAHSFHSMYAYEEY